MREHTLCVPKNYPNPNTVNNVFDNAGATIVLKIGTGTRSGASFSTFEILKHNSREDDKNKKKDKHKSYSKYRDKDKNQLEDHTKEKCFTFGKYDHVAKDYPVLVKINKEEGNNVHRCTKADNDTQDERFTRMTYGSDGGLLGMTLVWSFEDDYNSDNSMPDVVQPCELSDYLDYCKLDEEEYESDD